MGAHANFLESWALYREKCARENLEFDFNKIVSLVYMTGYLAAESRQPPAKIIEAFDAPQSMEPSELEKTIQ